MSGNVTKYIAGEKLRAGDSVKIGEDGLIYRAIPGDRWFTCPYNTEKGMELTTNQLPAASLGKWG